MEGTLPTAPHLTVVSPDRASIMNLEFGGETYPLPLSGEQRQRTLFEDLPMMEERIMGVFPKSALCRSKRLRFKRRLSLSLPQTLRTVVEEAPELADIIPDEYCEAPVEGKSLDSILSGDEPAEESAVSKKLRKSQQKNKKVP